MGLKIIGAGFGRTGTLSTYTALNELGYPCYHMMEVINNVKNKAHIDFWNRVANSEAGIQHNWNEVFENYTATVDNPGCCVWRELFEAYPDAKVLVTLHPRGPEAWYNSTINTIYFTENLWQFKVLKMTVPFMRKFGNMASKLIWQRSHKGTMHNETDAIQRYHDHIEEIKGVVPPNQLLIFTVNQGWEPLCEFLGEEVPDKPFPNVNDRKEILKTISDFTKGAYFVIGIAVLLVIAALYGLFLLL